MDISNPDHPCVADQSGEVEEISAGVTDDPVCATLYLHYDIVWYVTDIPFLLWRTDQYHYVGLRGGTGKSD